MLSTGSELLDVEEPLTPGRIRNSNAPMLNVLLREAGAEPVMLGRVPDRADEAEACIRQGLEVCDLVLTTGGVSVGDHDILVDILDRWEGQTLFNKVSMRPGSPTTAALLNGSLLIALSGNPGACFVGFHLFVAPAIRAMQRHPAPVPTTRQARLIEPFTKTNAYPRYIRQPDGGARRHPVGTSDRGRSIQPDDDDRRLRLPDGDPPAQGACGRGTLISVLSIR